jgi:phosphoribosyl-dephospho-CoA transferase
MELTVHDLLRLPHPSALVSRDKVPVWVRETLSCTPWVVVRRAPVEGEFFPVGVRGRLRSERFAAFVHSSSIIERVSPESLSSSQAWKKAVRREELPALRFLPRLYDALRTFDLPWGPVGSVGFELATGFPGAHRTSDLDLIVRRNDLFMPQATIALLLAILPEREVRVDLLLETTQGAISFREYASGEPNLLLRSVYGPSLIPNPQGKTFRPVGVLPSLPPGKEEETKAR